jgi:hypothetical protein
LMPQYWLRTDRTAMMTSWLFRQPQLYNPLPGCEIRYTKCLPSGV